MKPIDELTDDELRREIEERLGFGIAFNPDNQRWELKLDGRVLFSSANESYVRQRGESESVPNWSADVGAALELVIDLKGGVEIDTFTVPNTIIVKTRSIMVSVSAEKGIARALSELALGGLRAIEGNE